MTMNSPLTAHDDVEDLYREPSLQKQILFTQYAHGKLPWRDLAKQIQKIQPPPITQSKGRKFATVLVTVLVAFLIPPWMRRDN